MKTTKNLCLSIAKKQFAWDNNKPLQLALALPRICNANCIYCYTKQYKSFGEMMSLESIENLLKEAIEMGVETLIIPGYGEPMMHPKFWSIMELAESLGLYILVFSNATFISTEIAERLAKMPVSMMVKVNSLDAKKQDMLAGVEGFSVSQQKGLSALIAAGFNRTDENGQTRLAVDTLISKATIVDVPEVISWAIKNDIFPFVETMLYRGEALQNEDVLGSPEETDVINAVVLGQLNDRFPGRLHGQSTFGESCDAETVCIFVEASGHAVHCFSRRNVVGVFPKDSLVEMWESLRNERQELISEIDPRRANNKMASCQACGKCKGRLIAEAER